jgi:hypothetical protein
MTETQKILDDEAALEFRIQALKGLLRIRKQRLRQSIRRRVEDSPAKLAANMWGDIQLEMARCREQLRALRRVKRRRQKSRR